MKIVYCFDCTYLNGGIEKVTITKANALADIEGNEICLIVAENNGKPKTFVNPKIHIVDLNIGYYAVEGNPLKVYFSLIRKNKQHKQKLTAVLNEIMPDVVISTGQNESLFLPSIIIKSNPVRIREFHFTKPYKIYSAKNCYHLAKAYLQKFYEDNFILKKYDKIVVLTHEDHLQNWNGFQNVTVIPNPITIDVRKHSDLNQKTVISAGRLVRQKNYTSLIRAWSFVAKNHPDWNLEIWGDGSLKADLQKQIDRLELDSQVFLKGYTKIIFNEYLRSSIFVLSSIYEGLPLVIIEAMACGLPVISYSCPTGPKDIISNEKDGYLVPVNDEKRLADYICYLIENENIRKEMGVEAYKKTEQYRLDIIIKQWMDLFNGLIIKKSS